jgi:hypothetical protein
MTLPVGIHIIRVSFDAAGPSGVVGNLNYLRFSPAAGDRVDALRRHGVDDTRDNPGRGL